MVFTKEAKKDLIEKYRRHDTDVGSSEVQIAVFSARINYLTEHLKEHKKDHHTRYGLLKLVRKRQRLLTYLRRVSSERYQTIVTEMEIRG